MRTIIVAAVSRDGLITKGDAGDVVSWTSDEDKKFFLDIRSKHTLFVLGSKNYEAVRPKPEPGTLRVVLTSNPDEYAADAVDGCLVFKDLTPLQFVEKYSSKYDTCLNLGGSKIYRAFLDAGLVDEAYVTEEPVDNISGIEFLDNGKSIEDYAKNPPETTALNSKGTQLKHYVLK